MINGVFHCLFSHMSSKSGVRFRVQPISTPMSCVAGSLQIAKPAVPRVGVPVRAVPTEFTACEE